MNFAILALIANVSAYKLGEIMTDADYKFMEYVTKHGRSYATTAEYELRSGIFKNRLAKIEEHNAQGHSWKLGVNHLTDRTDEEIKKLLGYKNEPKTEMRIKKYNEANITPIDWRTKGAVTPVKDQGQCGSCWSFSTTGSMEGAHFVKTGQLVSLSEQNLCDCSWLQGNLGCNGGMFDRAFKYAEKHALETEADYPYTATSSLFGCKWSKDKGVVGVTTYNDVTPKSASQLQAALANQPVSVAIEADKDVFHQYTSGIISGSSCGTSLDHAVLLVGWGTDQATGTNYYILKNSWTTQWGEQGYARLAIEDGVGVCGVQMTPSVPTTN
jgi:C1A family cysteine protease